MPVCRYLADTNFISAYQRKDPKAKAWRDKHADQLGETPFTLGEIRRGIELSKDPKARPALERKFRQVLEDYREAIYVFDEAAAGEWGRMTADMSTALPPLDDSYIAAIARTYAMTVVTRNTQHVCGCNTVNPREEY